MRRNPKTFLILGLLLAAPASAAELRIVGPGDEAVAGAKVEIWPCAEDQKRLRLLSALAEGETGPDGTLPRGLPQIDCLALIVDAPGFAPWQGEVGLGQPGRVRLVKGGRIAGSLRELDDRPAAAVELCARWETSVGVYKRIRRWRRCATTSTEGRFVLDGLPGGEVELLAKAPGMAPLRRKARVGEEVALRLLPGVVVNGRVVDLAGGAIAGAIVTAPAEVEATTDREGAFSIAPGELPTDLEVSADGFRTRTMRLEKAPAEGQLRIALERGEQLSGTLLGEQGEEVPRAEIWMDRRQEHAWQTQRHSVETRGGAFRVPLPGAGEYRLHIRARGFREARTEWLEVGPASNFPLGVVTLLHGASVAGRLVDTESGLPMAGVDLSLFPQGGAFATFQMYGGIRHEVSDAEGRFLLDAPGGGRYELRSERSGYAPLALSVRVFEDRVSDLGDLRLGKGVRFSGQVARRSTRAGLPGATLRFFDAQGADWLPIVETTSNDQGSYGPILLQPGSYLVRISTESLLLAQQIELEPGEPSQEVSFRVGGARLQGVVHRAGEPAGAGTLMLRSALDPSARRGKVILNYGTQRGERLGSDAFNLEQSVVSCDVKANGTFAVEDSPRGVVRATFASADGVSISKEVTISDDAEPYLTVDLAGVALAGRVLDAVSGQGLSALVELISASGGKLGTVYSDESGAFLLPEVDAGSYSLRAALPGYADTIVGQLNVASDTPRLEIRLEPSKGGKLEIQILRDDGSAVAGALVSVLTSSGHSLGSLPTGALGEVAFPDLPAGAHTVVWSDIASGTGAASGVKVVAGESTRFEKTLLDGGALQIHCETDFCGDRAVASLSLRDENGVALEPYLSGVSTALRFSPAGDLGLGWLAPGKYTLDLSVGAQHWTRQVRVDSPLVEIGIP